MPARGRRGRLPGPGWPLTSAASRCTRWTPGPAIAALALPLSLLVAACAPAAPSPAPAPAQPAAPPAATSPSGASAAASSRPAPALSPAAPVAAEPIKVAIPGRTFGFLPFFVALHNGFFREEGLDPIDITVVSGDLQPAALQTGEVDYAGAGGTIGRAATQGLPIKLILFLYERPTWSLVARPELTAPAQLRGKTLGVTRVGTSDDVAARLAATHLGLNADTDLTLVSVGVSVIQGLLGGAVDAAILNADAAAVARAQGYHELVALADVAVWPFSGFGVADAKRTQQRAQVKRYARAQVKGLQFMLDHEPEVVQIAVDELGLEPEIARLALETALRSVSRTNPGGVSPEGLARFIDTELRPGLPADMEIAPAQFIDLTVIEEAQRELGVRGS